jgi:hypothetical protein
MLNARRVIAFCLLLGWLVAIGHVAIEHGSAVERDVHHELIGHDDDHDHHDDGEQEEEDHHHHDLLALAGGPFLKAAEHNALAPVWVPLHSALLERLTVILREAREQPVGLFDFGDSPPDSRASGWLLVVQTALQVRGPSLV